MNALKKNGVRFYAGICFLFCILALIGFQQIVTASHYQAKYLSTFFSLLVIFFVVASLASITIFTLSFFLRKNLLNILILFFSVFITLMVIELRLRATGTFNTYQEHRDGFYRSILDLKPADKYLTWGNGKEHWITTPEFSYWRPTNKHGLGDYEFDSLSQLPGIKIMGLGDSFTEGDGAPYDSSWVKQLGKMLQQKKGVPVVTMDAGICGNDPIYAAVQFKNEFLKYHPDIAVLCVNVTDLDDVRTRGGLERFKADGTLALRAHPWWEAFYAPVHLCRLYIHKVLGYDFTFTNKQEYERNPAVYVDKLKNTVMFFTETCSAQNIYPIIVMHPMRHELQQSHYTPALDSLTTRLQNVKNLHFVNVLHFMLQLPANDRDIRKIYWDTDLHHNSAGYNIMAKAILERIDTLGIFNNKEKIK